MRKAWQLGGRRVPSGASMGPQLDSCGRYIDTKANLEKMNALQWGRNLTVAEGGLNPARLVFYLPASMGPQLDSCGRVRLGGRGRRGARASMGPQLDSCGRAKIWAAVLAKRGASMGPQLDSCGRAAADQYLAREFIASMGPQLDSCGRGAQSKSGLADTWLQWGRNLTVAEGCGAHGATMAASGFNGAAT